MSCCTQTLPILSEYITGVVNNKSPIAVVNNRLISTATTDIIDAISPIAEPRKNNGRITKGSNIIFQLGMIPKMINTIMFTKNEKKKLESCIAAC